MLSIFNKGKNVNETASKIFSDGILTLIMSIIMSSTNGITEEEIKAKVEEKIHVNNITNEVKSLENLGVIERKGDKIILTEFGIKVSRVLKDMLEIYYKTFTSLSSKKR